MKTEKPATLRVEDHIKIVTQIQDESSSRIKGLEIERDMWKAKAEGWFCIGCQKFMNEVEKRNPSLK